MSARICGPQGAREGSHLPFLHLPPHDLCLGCIPEHLFLLKAPTTLKALMVSSCVCCWSQLEKKNLRHPEQPLAPACLQATGWGLSLKPHSALLHKHPPPCSFQLGKLNLKNHDEDRQADSESASYQPNDTGQVNFFFITNEDNNQCSRFCEIIW